MDRQPRPRKPTPYKLSPRDAPALSGHWFSGLWLSGLLLAGGCSWLEHSKLKQVQSENDRLIGEFRAERKRSSVLDERNEALSDRVAALENRLAAVSDSLREESLGESRSVAESLDASPPPAEEPERLAAPKPSWRQRF